MGPQFTAVSERLAQRVLDGAGRRGLRVRQHFVRDETDRVQIHAMIGGRQRLGDAEVGDERVMAVAMVWSRAYLDDGRYADAGTSGSVSPVSFAATAGGRGGGGAGLGSGGRVGVSGRNSTGDNLRPADRSNA